MNHGKATQARHPGQVTSCAGCVCHADISDCHALSTTQARLQGHAEDATQMAMLESGLMRHGYDAVQPS